jgi:hypothetical protein
MSKTFKEHQERKARNSRLRELDGLSNRSRRRAMKELQIGYEDYEILMRELHASES